MAASFFLSVVITYLPFALFLIVSLYFNSLVIITEIFSEQGTSPHIGGIFRNLKAEADVAVIIQIQILDGHIGNFIVCLLYTSPSPRD